MPGTDNVRPFPVAKNWRDGSPVVGHHPRLRAIEYLDDRIADGKAGLDPYDPAIFIVLDADPIRMNAHLREVGVLLSSRLQSTPTRTVYRARAVIEADVRKRLGLDDTDTAPVMNDEPLASRAVQ